MKKHRIMAVALASLAFAVSVPPADARVGGGNTSSSSRAASPAPSRNAAPAPSRVGGGQSLGMSRSNAVSQAREQQAARRQAAPAPSTPAYSANNVAGNQGQSRQQYGSSNQYNRYDNQQDRSNQDRSRDTRSGYSGAQVAGAAALAGVAGYALGHSTSSDKAPAPAYNNPPAGNYTGGGAVGANGSYGAEAPAASYNAPSQSSGVGLGYAKSADQSSSGFPWGLVLVLLLVAGGIVFYFHQKRKTTPTSNTSSPDIGFTVRDTAPPAMAAFRASAAPSTSSSEQTLLSEGPQLFRDMQAANNRNSISDLKSMTEPGDLQDEVVRMANERKLGKAPTNQTEVVDLEVVNNRVLAFEKVGDNEFGSLHFAANVTENGEPDQFEEVWNFVRAPGQKWKLVGIDQI